jgi:PEP-CTERM motif-containing protein
MQISRRALLVCTVLFALSAPAWATPIPAALSFTGDYQYDVTGGDELAIAGAATQSGSIFAREGGVDTPTTLLDLIVTGSNPLSGTLTDHGNGVLGAGDGFGGLATGSASGTGFHGFFSDTDLGDGEPNPLTIANSALLDTFQIFFSLTFEHTATAGGVDGWADSDLEVLLDGVEIFESKLTSDTIFGNEIDHSPVSGFGGPVSASGSFLFSIQVGPGGFRTVGLDHTMEGTANLFEPPDDPFSSSSVSVPGYFLSVDNVVNLGEVPEPGSYVLFGSGLLALMALRRLRRPRRQS